MIRSLWASATGMNAQALNLDVISNNLANVSTAGFKKSRAEFQDLLYETIRPAGTSSSQSTQVPTGIQLGHGTRPSTVVKIFSQGELEQTKNELDLAIEGDGFFQIAMPSGETAFTRDGGFKLDSEGRIVNPDGFALEPEISIPTDTVSISVGMDGTVSVLQAGETTPTEVGTIELARFVNSAGLISVGKNLHIPSEASGDAMTGTAGEEGLGTIAQGFLERSNVTVVEEMVSMITAQRAYEANSKSIQTADEMLAIANNIKR
ncbi:flagellar basal body rod protein FlgG [Alkalispirochaeta odontotermitis]|nr:flagellar basal body rod protein FlgG [Alkalispirochaeta odontotermitis]CAB1068079.1 Flagellar basal-body rod protein FlgG [Olavius algarvensis Delta 1 endosymbiont]